MAPVSRCSDELGLSEGSCWTIRIKPLKRECLF